MMQWIVSSSVLILVVIALRYVLRGKLRLRCSTPCGCWCLCACSFR